MPKTLQHEFVQVYQGENGETVQPARVLISEIAMPGFQRDRKQHFIKKIAADPDKTAYIFPIVAYFQGEYVCIDGQQRIAAWEERGETSVTVQLVGGINKPERLAEIFVKINRDRKLLDPFEKYVGALASKDRGSLEIEKMVEDEFGLEIAKKATGNNKIPAGAVVKIHSLGGAPLLRRVLTVREQAWGGNGAHETNEARTLLGLASFLRRYQDKVDDNHLIRVLRRRHPGFILTAIQRHQGGELSYADFLRKEYNGLRGAKRL